MLKSLKTVAASITLLAAATAAHAVTGNEYLTWTNGEQLTFVMGVADMVPRGEICVPDGVTYLQMHAIVAKGMSANPGVLHLPASTLTTVMLKSAFPCPKQQRENSKIL